MERYALCVFGERGRGTSSGFPQGLDVSVVERQIANFFSLLLLKVEL